MATIACLRPNPVSFPATTVVEITGIVNQPGNAVPAALAKSRRTCILGSMAAVLFRWINTVWFRRALAFWLVFSAATVGLAQTTPQPAATALPVFPIQPGSSVEGNISDSSPAVRYSIDARAGDVLTLRMDATSGNLDPFLTLFGPDEELIDQDDDSGDGRNAAITTTLPRPGRYIIEASRYGQGSAATSTGTFRLTVEIAGLGQTDPADPLATIPNFGLTPAPGIVAYRVPTAAALDDLVPERYFAFGGERGDLVRVIMATTSGDLSPEVEILNRSLLSITSSAAQSRPTEAIAYATLPETGWYLIRSTRSSGAGNFDLYVDRLLAGQELTIGEAVTGEFTAGAPVVSYVFNARAGDLIAANLFATDSASSVTPEIRLLDLNLQTLAQGAGSRFATLRRAIPRSGTYILQAINTNPQATGAFNLRLTGVPVDVSKLPVSAIGYNQQATGRIDDETPVQYYRFAGKAGERVTIEMNAVSGDLDPFLILSDGNLNEELSFNDNVSATRNARIVRYRLAKDGDYLILATRAGLAEGTTSGEFSLVLTVGDIALTPGALSASLTWSAPADLNLFVRDPAGRIVSWSNPSIPGGGTLQIDSNTNCETPTDQPVEHIYWPDGPLEPGDYDIWVWYQQPCVSAEAVQFALSVAVNAEPVLQTPAGAAILRPGQRFEARLRVAPDGRAFVLDAGRVSNPSPQQEASEGGDRLIVYGDAVQAAITDEVYAVFYQFHGAAGDRVQLRAETLTGDLDPVIVLRDANDRNLPNGINDDASPSTRNSELDYTLPADGQYIVAVTRFGVRDGTTTGTFRLTLDKVEP